MNRSAIVWVSTYASVGLTESQCNAEGFATALGAQLVLDRHEQEAVDTLFERPTPAAVEAAHIAYYVGHGLVDGPVFAVIGEGDGIAHHDQVELGSGDLAYAVFDCCLALELDRMGQWEDAFNGLHYLFGFDANIQESPFRGTYFANLLRQRVPFPKAWSQAVIESEKSEQGVHPWSCLRAITEGPTVQEDEIWSASDPPRKDPPPPLAFLGAAEKIVRELQPLPPPEFRDTVTLFRTPRPAVEESLTPLAAKFDLEGAPRTSRPGSTVLRRAGSSLEYYPESGAFWWTRDRPRAGELFKAPSPPPPSEEQAVPKAADFLEQGNFLDPRAFAFCVTETRERHSNRVGDRQETFAVARHVDYLFRLNDLLVMGPGAKIRVGFSGEDADEIYKFWREPVPAVAALDILTVDDAEKLLRSHSTFAHLPEQLVVIRSRRLGYYALPPREPQDHLLPVYAFQGTVAVPGTVTRPALEYEFVRYVQAALPDFRETQPENSVFRRPTVFA